MRSVCFARYAFGEINGKGFDACLKNCNGASISLLGAIIINGLAGTSTAMLSEQASTACLL